MAEAGDTVRVLCADEELEGILVPGEDDSFLVLKLNSGYNIGIKKSKVKKIELLKKHKEAKKKKQNKADKESKNTTISVLILGGTLTSKVDYKTGGVTSNFETEEIIEMFPELTKIASIKPRLVRNIMSDNMRFDHYNLMAKEIEKEIKKGADGVIITHGTDTFHYTAAALSFALENISIPVVMVGSQRSSDRPSTDSHLNMASAAMFITNTSYKGVFTCLHETIDDNTCLIVKGTKVRKMHTSRRDAFRSINAPPVARINYGKKQIEKISPEEKTGEKFKVRLFNPKLKIGLVKMHTNFYASQLDTYKNFDGIILEAFALGQAQILAQDSMMKENLNVARAIKKLAKKMPVGVTSQCIYGRVDMNVYAEGRELQKLGVIGNDLDMIPETAFIKLAWLLSNYKQEDAKKLFHKNLRGEISEQIQKNTFLI